METVSFKNRREAGRQLGKVLAGRGYAGENALVLGISRGGLVVAEEVASALSATLDVIFVKKLRAPYRPELGIGAVLEGDRVLLNEEMVRSTGASQDYLSREIAFQKGEIERRLRSYRGHRPPPEIAGRTVIVVGDGIATGDTFRACLEGLRQDRPGLLIAAAPVATLDSVEMLKIFADEVACLKTPSSFFAVRTWYQNFEQVGDDEAATILHRNRSKWPLAA